MNRVSAKRRKRMAVYARSRQEVADRAQGRCEARVAGICTGAHQETHHKRRRSQGGSDEPSNLEALCTPCHLHIHANPAWAEAAGHLIFARSPEPLSLAVTKVERAS